MIRSVWLAFIFLAFIGALAVFKAGVATAPTQQVALAAPAVAQDAVPPDAAIQEASAQEVLAKADKLDDVTDRKPVQAIAIVPPQAAPQLQEKTTKIISRNWRDSYAKVKKRKHHRHHATRTKKHRGQRR
jgi:uncharacterized iron-regulated membrane protein